MESKEIFVLDYLPIKGKHKNLITGLTEYENPMTFESINPIEQIISYNCKREKIDNVIQEDILQTNTKRFYDILNEPDFKLLHQPKTIQRKSFLTENRYLLPIPVIEYTKNSNAYKGGTIIVTLVNSKKEEIKSDHPLLEGDIAVPLQRCTKFRLKLLQIRHQETYLKFSIYYGFRRSQIQIIYSAPFIVKSKTAKSKRIADY